MKLEALSLNIFLLSLVKLLAKANFTYSLQQWTKETTLQKVKLMTFLIDSNFVIFFVIFQLLSLGSNVRQDVF